MSYDEQFYRYLNIARENPTYFVPLLDKQISLFTNEREMTLNEDVLYQTNEGRGAWIQARSFLLAQKPLMPFKKHFGLMKSAEDHKNDLCSNRIFGHTGSDHSTFSQRILRYCKKGPGAMAEIIGSDFNFIGRNTAEMTVLGLIIDDGVKERGHRKTIFSPSYKYVGWSSGSQDQKIITVFNLTENYLQNLHSTENSFYAQKDNKYFSRSLGYQPQSPLRDATNYNFDAISSKPITDYKPSMNGMSQNSSKNLAQKLENSRTYIEDGCKVIETTTKYIYKDGTVEQKSQKRTIYPEQ